MNKRGDQIHEEQLDIPQVFPRSYEELFVARLHAHIHELGFELVPLDELEEEGEE